MKNENDYFTDSEDVMVSVSRYRAMLKENRILYFDIHEFLNVINFYQEQNKTLQAMEAVEIALNQHPVSTELLLKKAQVFFEKGNTLESLNIIRKLEKIEVTNPEIFLLKGGICSVLGKFAEAEEAFEIAINNAGEDLEDMLYSASMAFENIGRFDKAVHFLERALSMSPDNDILLYDLAYCYEKTGEFEKSVTFYEKYLEEQPFSENAWYNLGIVYNTMGDFDKAIEAYDYALAIDEEYASAHFNKGNSFANKELYTEAIESYRDCLIYEPVNSQAYYYMGECYEKLDDQANALLFFRKALKIDKEFPDAWFGIGLIFMDQEDFYEALYYVKRALKLDDSNAEYWFALANIYSKLNYFEESRKAFVRTTSLDPFDSEFWVSYSELLYNNNKLDDAITILEEGSNYMPEDATLNYRLAAYFIAKNDEPRALEFLKTGLSIDSDAREEFLDNLPNNYQSDSIQNLLARK